VLSHFVPDGANPVPRRLTILALAATVLVYFGTYTGPKSKGIYVAPFDTATGKLGALRVAGRRRIPRSSPCTRSARSCTR
jgi:hypothetical protein